MFLLKVLMSGCLSLCLVSPSYAQMARNVTQLEREAYESFLLGYAIAKGISSNDAEQAKNKFLTDQAYIGGVNPQVLLSISKTVVADLMLADQQGVDTRTKAQAWNLYQQAKLSWPVANFRLAVLEICTDRRNTQNASPVALNHLNAAGDYFEALNFRAWSIVASSATSASRLAEARKLILLALEDLQRWKLLVEIMGAPEIWHTAAVIFQKSNKSIDAKKYAQRGIEELSKRTSTELDESSEIAVFHQKMKTDFETILANKSVVNLNIALGPTCPKEK